MRAKNKERGAALIELAVVLPLLLALILGALDFGLAFMDRLTVRHAASQSARNGSALGADAAADLLILQGIEAGLAGAVDANVITRVLIYEADLNGDIQGNTYNQYVYDTAFAPCNWNPCPDPAGTPVYGNPSNWGDPSGISTCPGGTTPNRDNVLDSGGPCAGVATLGVRICYNHTWLTGILPIFNGTVEWCENARNQVEPDVFGT